MKTKICRNCAIEIPDGSSAKRAFCCDKCRNDYNILRRNERDGKFLNFLNGLSNNYKVLRIWEKNPELSVTLLQLIDNGFSIEYLPESRIDKYGKYYCFGDFHLYEIGTDFSNFIFRNTKLA
ncbi:MAG: hypothetical protein J0L87_15445 [Bacteroidetes bacterium]|nr:hypothetical protein [Bacteroidota bacterium]